jgi:hypothetical protein
MDVNNNEVRSYATKARLIKGLQKFGLDKFQAYNLGKEDHCFCRYVIVNTESGRWTAIFLVSEYMRERGGYIGFASQHGFMSV